MDDAANPEGDYYQRYRVCQAHLTLSVLLMQSVPHRFCQVTAPAPARPQAVAAPARCACAARRRGGQRARGARSNAGASTTWTRLTAIAGAAPAGARRCSPCLQTRHSCSVWVEACTVPLAASVHACSGLCRCLLWLRCRAPCRSCRQRLNAHNDRRRKRVGGDGGGGEGRSPYRGRGRPRRGGARRGRGRRKRGDSSLSVSPAPLAATLGPVP